MGKTEEDLRKVLHHCHGQYSFSSMATFIKYVPVFINLGLMLPRKLEISGEAECAEFTFMCSVDIWVRREGMGTDELFWDAFMPFTKRSFWYINVPYRSVAYNAAEAWLVMRKLKGDVYA